ncbi:hypothetical protein [Bradyrhizobium sp.]|uniref:hypothetical protein n=1 Tax=Bradyrhizobium sp. TaxID=376 RepID=UPI0007C91116|nr:hypothetical protein [Bradyrhizobium sp.]
MRAKAKRDPAVKSAEDSSASVPHWHFVLACCADATPALFAEPSSTFEGNLFNFPPAQMIILAEALEAVIRSGRCARIFWEEGNPSEDADEAVQMIGKFASFLRQHARISLC